MPDTTPIEVKRRSWPHRVLQSPRLFWKLYRISRRVGVGRTGSVRAALVFVRLLVKRKLEADHA